MAYGKCRGPYVKEERRFQRAFVAASGGLAGIGLARAAAKDRALDPETPATFATFSTRSRLDAETAKLGVVVANALEETERFFQPALFLAPGAGDKGNIVGAMVWFDRNQVSRIMVNFASSDVLSIKGELTKLYGGPKVKGTQATWKPDGAAASIVLDHGAPMMVTVARE